MYPTKRSALTTTKGVLSMVFRTMVAAVAVFVLLVPAAGFSEIVTRDEAAVVARNFLNQMIASQGTWGGASQATVGECTQLWREDDLLGYHFSVSPRGYIFVPILKEPPPIKAFSTSIDFDLLSEEGFPQPS